VKNKKHELGEQFRAEIYVIFYSDKSFLQKVFKYDSGEKFTGYAGKKN
jgi:hypothetical protein